MGKSLSESGYTGPTHDNVHRIIREALVKHKKDRLRHHIDDRCEKVVLDLFQEALERTMGNTQSSTYRVMQQAAVKAFFSGGADELLHQKMYKIAKSYGIKRVLVRHRTILSTFTLPVPHFVKQKAKKSRYQ